MEIISKIDDEIKFNRFWIDFVKSSDDISYKYLPLNLNYSINYSKDLLLDKSFVVVENNKCVGICFLPIENIDNTISVSISNGYTISPLSINKRVEKFIYQEIENISNQINIQKIMFYIDPITNKDKNNFNSLLSYGFINSSSTDCWIDLKLDITILWSNLRKSYKALINKILKDDDYEIIYINSANINHEYHNTYIDLHYACTGGETRDKKTFDNQYQAIVDNYATLIGLKYKGNFICMGYFSHFNKVSSYSSGVDDPIYDNMNIPIYHVMLWSAIQYLKKQSFEVVIFNQPCGYNKINGFDDYLDQKQINISHFKRGMGTQILTLHRGIKYYNKSLSIEDIDRFKNKMI